jgi:hypothetical protein
MDNGRQLSLSERGREDSFCFPVNGRIWLAFPWQTAGAANPLAQIQIFSPLDNLREA